MKNKQLQSLNKLEKELYCCLLLEQVMDNKCLNEAYKAACRAGLIMTAILVETMLIKK